MLLKISVLPKGNFFSVVLNSRNSCYKSHPECLSRVGFCFFLMVPTLYFLKSFYKYIFLIKP